jgi:hypothetical protein
MDWQPIRVLSLALIPETELASRHIAFSRNPPRTARLPRRQRHANRTRRAHPPARHHGCTHFRPRGATHAIAHVPNGAARSAQTKGTLSCSNQGPPLCPGGDRRACRVT